MMKKMHPILFPASEHPAIEHARLAFTDGPGFWVNYCHAPHDSLARCVCVRSKGILHLVARLYFLHRRFVPGLFNRRGRKH